MKTSKGFKLFSCVAACALLGGLVAVLAPKAVNELSKAGASNVKSMTITAADFEAVSGNGTINVGKYDRFTVANATFETIDGKRYVVFGSTSYIQSANSAGVNADGGVRGAGYTSIVLKNKICNIGSGITYYDVNGDELQYAGVGSETGGDHQINFPELEEEIVRFRYGNVGGGGYVKFTAIQLNYNCDSAAPTLTLTSSPSFESGETVTITKKFKNTGGTTPSVTYTQTGGTGSVTINGETVTANAVGTVSLKATFSYGEYLNVDSNTLNFEVVNSISYSDISFSSASHLSGAGVYLVLDNSEMGLTNDDIGKLTSVTMLFDDNSGAYAAHEASGANPMTLNQAKSFSDASASSIQLNMSVNIGLPDNADYTHKFTLRIEKGSTIYEGYVVIWGNTCVINNNGTIIPVLNLSANSQSLEKGDTLTLTKQFIGVTAGDVEDLTFVSSNNSYATVDANGVVTGVGAGSVTISATFNYNDKPYTSKTNVTLLITDSSAQVEYFAWHNPQLVVQGAGILVCVNYTAIGYTTNNEANAVIASVNVVVTGKNCNKADFQTPPWSGGSTGLYVNFPDADFSQITKITVTMPGKTGSAYEGKTYTAELELTFSGSTPNITKINGAAV